MVNGVLRKSNYGYGMNNWLEGFYPDNGDYIPKLDTRLPLVNVPGIADCVWGDGGWPKDSDKLARDLNDPLGFFNDAWGYFMARFFLESPWRRDRSFVPGRIRSPLQGRPIVAAHLEPPLSTNPSETLIP